LLCATPSCGQSPAEADSQPASNAATITYRRVFKGSTPEFVEIVMRQDGAVKADVRQLDEEATPEEFVADPALRDHIFELAAQLNHFQGADLDARRRVAFMGQKTFRWEYGNEAYEAEYNYTTNAQAAQLQKLFDNLAQEQADLALLEYCIRYDRLGVHQALNQFEDHLTGGNLPEPTRFLPLLDRIAEDARLIEVARQHARSLAARIRVAESRQR
jgi:hypothetical protein